MNSSPAMDPDAPDLVCQFDNVQGGRCSLLRQMETPPELAKASKPLAFTAGASLVVPEVSYRWHLPETNATEKSRLSHLQQHRMGWLTYGAILEKFQKQDSSLMGRVKGCIVDSAPVAAAYPAIWASGFSAAFLKKNSVATKGSSSKSSESNMGARINGINFSEPKPAATETTLVMVLEKLCTVILNIPKVNRRLADVVDTL